MSDSLVITENVTLYNADGSKAPTVTTDGAKERLDVETNLTARIFSPVHQEDMNRSAATHISYTVPTGKILWIQTLTACYADGSGGENYLEWQEDGSGFHPQYISDGAGYVHALFTDGNPIGPFAAGVLIRAQRISGASRDWSASFTGYLEDE